MRSLSLSWLALMGLVAVWLLPVAVSWKDSPDLGHALAVPLLMAYLWWERWGERPAIVERGRLGPGWWVLALAIGSIQLPLRLLLTPFPLWPAILAAYSLVLVSVVLIAGWLLAGKNGVRWLAGPLILVFSSLPVPSLVESSIIIPLREVMANLAAEISNLAGQPALASGTSVRLGNGWVGIDEACGGIRSLQACVMIGLFFGEWYRFRLGKRIMLIVAGVVAALAGNFSRVLFLSLRAGAGEQAMEAAHDLAGWLAMAASIVLTGWLASRWAGYRWPEQKVLPREARTNSPGGRWAAAVVAVFAVNEAATRWWYWRGESVRSDLPQWTANLPVGHGTFQPQLLADSAREMLRPDSFVAGRWRARSDLLVSAYYVVWEKGQIARSVPFLHNPTVCLPLAGCELVQALDPITVQWQGGELPFFAYKFRRMGEELLVAFTVWDSARGRPLARTDDNRSWLQWWLGQWTEVREARQHQPAQNLTVSMPWRENAPQQMQALLESLVGPVNVPRTTTTNR